MRNLSKNNEQVLILVVVRYSIGWLDIYIISEKSFSSYRFAVSAILVACLLLLRAHYIFAFFSLGPVNLILRITDTRTIRYKMQTISLFIR